jgi:hypothetical protein
MAPDARLKELASFLCAHREEITRRWVDAVRTDPAIGSSTKLPHEQLMDHLPLVFDDLAQTLGRQPRRGNKRPNTHTSTESIDGGRAFTSPSCSAR